MKIWGSKFTHASVSVCQTKRGRRVWKKWILKHVVDKAFDISHGSLCDNIHNIHSTDPPEGLHTFGNGLNEAIISKIVDVAGMENENKSDKSKLNKLHHIIY